MNSIIKIAVASIVALSAAACSPEGTMMHLGAKPKTTIGQPSAYSEPLNCTTFDGRGGFRRVPCSGWGWFFDGSRFGGAGDAGAGDAGK